VSRDTAAIILLATLALAIPTFLFGMYEAMGALRDSRRERSRDLHGKHRESVPGSHHGQVTP
jgi:hypothetical protein